MTAELWRDFSFLPINVKLSNPNVYTELQIHNFELEAGTWEDFIDRFKRFGDDYSPEEYTKGFYRRVLNLSYLFESKRRQKSAEEGFLFFLLS